MKLTVVGSAPAYTSRPGRASSSYLVEHGRDAVLLDMGQGTFSELWRHRSPGDVRAVFISHLHADHCVDLIPFRHWARYANGGRAPAVHGPAELRDRFDRFQAQPDFLGDFGGGPLEPAAVQIGGLTIEVGRVTHIPDSFGFRVSAAGGDGPGLVYSGDCSVADDLLPLIRPGDTLLCEAAYGAGPAGPPMHLTAAQAASAAAGGGAGRLILTHLLDGRPEDAALEAARSVFGGAVEIARPGLELEIGRPD